MRASTLNRWVAAAIVASALVAACVGNLTLSSNEQAVLEYPTTVQIGSTPIGTPAKSGAIEIRPQNTTDYDQILSIEKAPGACNNQFSIDAQNLPSAVFCDDGTRFTGAKPGSASTCIAISYSFNVTFLPTVAGPQSCTVRVVYLPNGTSTSSGSAYTGTFGSNGANYRYVDILVMATGLGNMYDMTVSPPTIPFGEVRMGQASAATQITVRNTGTSGFQVTPVFVQNAASAFISTLTAKSLPANGVATYDVVCNPPALTAYTALLRFTTSPGNIVKEVMLSCTGIETNIYLTPTPATFARGTLVGAPPQPIAVVLHNDTGGPVAITSITLEAGNPELSFVAPGGTLAAGTTPIMISYSAMTEHAYGQLDRLVVNAGGVTRRVTIAGEALIGELGLSPSSIDFGPVCVDAIRSEEVQLYTTASGPVTITSVVPPAMPFTAAGSDLELEGNHGSLGKITATVKATTPGELSDKVTLMTTIPDARMQDITLRATALPAGASATPAIVPFGPAAVDTLTSAKKVVVSNCGQSSRTVVSVKIEGDSAADFSLVGPEDPLVTLATADKVELLVVMRPASVGVKTAQLVIELDDGTKVTADLDGNGFTGDDTGGDSEQATYYTCSVGGASGALPIGLALLAVARRRRRR